MSGDPYPIDLTDAQWEKIAILIPSAKPGVHPHTIDIREILNAILYLLFVTYTINNSYHNLTEGQN